MARIKYYYDTETCKYERIKVSKWDIVINSMGFLTVSFILAVGLVFAFTKYFESPKEIILKKENAELKLHYDILDKEMKDVTKMLSALEERDDNVYRVIFEAEPIPSNVRKAGAGGAQKYGDILDAGLEHR